MDPSSAMRDGLISATVKGMSKELLGWWGLPGGSIQTNEGFDKHYGKSMVSWSKFLRVTLALEVEKRWMAVVGGFATLGRKHWAWLLSESKRALVGGRQAQHRHFSGR